MLLQIYAKCLVGQDDAARRRIDAVLRATSRDIGDGSADDGPSRPVEVRRC
jgi:hypothetical protein